MRRQVQETERMNRVTPASVAIFVSTAVLIVLFTVAIPLSCKMNSECIELTREYRAIEAHQASRMEEMRRLARRVIEAGHYVCATAAGAQDRFLQEHETLMRVLEGKPRFHRCGE